MLTSYDMTADHPSPACFSGNPPSEERSNSGSS
jgi:hypothetical protein